MTAERNPRDRVPDRGSVMWNGVPWWWLLGVGSVNAALSGGCFWWSQVDHSGKGPVFLLAIGAIFACIAIGCLLWLIWHGGIRLRQRTHDPS